VAAVVAVVIAQVKRYGMVGLTEGALTMTLYVALCYYDRDHRWDSVPDMEFTPEYTEFARRPPRPRSCAAAKLCTR
jgi:hypothetical protein